MEVNRIKEGGKEGGVFGKEWRVRKGSSSRDICGEYEIGVLEAEGEDGDDPIEAPSE